MAEADESRVNGVGMVSDRSGHTCEHVVLGQHVHDGMVMAGAFPAPALDEIKEFRFYDGDIIIATYPKAGTTWMQEVLYLVMNGADTMDAEARPLAERVPFIEANIPGRHMSLDLLRNRPSPRLIKTHLHSHSFEKMLATKKTKVIVVMRNAKDNLVSYYHFYRSSQSFGHFKGTFTEFLQLFDKKHLVHGDWYDFNLGWWKHKDNENIMFTTYEDMSKDIKKVIRQVAVFVGRPLSEQQLQTICAHVGFEKMRHSESVMTYFNQILDSKISPFMGKGKVGHWRNYYTPAQSDKFDQDYRDKIVGTGLEFILWNGH